MSLELYENEAAERLSGYRPVTSFEPGAFDGFWRGAGLTAMQTLAKAGRAVDLLGSVAPILLDKMSGGTEAQDRYFAEHDETFGRAVDFWTPRPNEVGVAGQIVGQLAATLPMVIASPGFTVGQTQLAVAEDVVRKGVSPGKAQAVGAAQAAGLGLGIWFPILGQNLWQRLFLGGAGFNVAQGVAMRGASELILADTAAAEDFKAFDWSMVTLDVLLGLAFGGIAHLSPAQRAQGAKVWGQLREWGIGMKPSDVDAIAALRQAQHLNVDSMPGRPVDVTDIEAHVQRLRTAIDQLATDRPVEVSDLPAARVEPDAPRMAENEIRARELVAAAERVRVEENLPPIEPEAPLATRQAGTPPGEPELARASAFEGEPIDPVAAEAQRIATEQPDVEMTLGKDADGQPVKKTIRQFLDDSVEAARFAEDDARLFEVAANCMIGGGA